MRAGVLAFPELVRSPGPMHLGYLIARPSNLLLSFKRCDLKPRDAGLFDFALALFPRG